MDLARRARGPAGRRLAAAMAALLAAACTGPGRDGGGRPAPPPTATTAASPRSPADGEPRYLEGRPLAGPTGLALLVASDPPRVVDVDRGTSRRVEGLPAGREPVGVSPVGGGAILAADQEVFVLRRGTWRARPVGRASYAVASLDGQGIWLLEQGSGCTLREVALDGRARRPPRRLPCSTGLSAETRLGLLAWTAPTGDGDEGALLDPRSGRAVARYPEIHGVAGDLVLWGGHERDAGSFTLTDRRNGASHPVARPTPYGEASIGLASPDGRLLAVEFADPSWSRAHGQISDIWLLDTRTRGWRRLPGMPLITALKFMDMAWTGDGRLLLAGNFDRFGEALASWRPGQDHLAVRRLDLPEPAGSDSFVPWPAAGS